MARKTGSHSDITGPKVRDAALDLISGRGFAAVSMRQIAAEVGVQAGALYNYTPDKQSLLFSLLKGHMDDLLAAWAAEPTARDPVERLARFTRFHIRFNIERPEAIFIGHGHFDHAGDAAEIAAASGAEVVGTKQQCEQIRGQAGPRQRIRTRAVGDAADAPGTRKDVTIAGIDLSVMAHIHSAPKRPDREDPAMPLRPLPGVGALIRHRPTMTDLRHLCSHLRDPAAGTLLYQFRGGDTSITWHDSSGPIPESAPWLTDALRGLPDTTV